MIKAIIFDCFGVLIADAFKDMVGTIETTDPDRANVLRKTMLDSNKGLLSRDDAHRALAATLDVSVKEYRKRIAHREQKDERLLAFVVELRKKYKTALLSNISVIGLHRRFSDDELSQYFEVVVASGAVGFVKPEPQIYLIAADQLGVKPEECVFIDDIDRYCDGARATGMAAIRYKDFDDFKRKLEEIVA